MADVPLLTPALADTASALPVGSTAAERSSRPWSDALKPGTVMAERYLLRRYLAAGGMGEVWEAEDLTLGEGVALKTIRPDRLSAETALRFQAEVKLARRLSHRHLCRIFEFGQHPMGDGVQISFLTMELLHGKLLIDVIRERGPMPVPEALVILEQLASALDAAHAAGVVHRDFKSPNIFLEQSPTGVRSVITDFGLARDVAADSRITVDTRLQMGTPAYMAPEQVEGLDVGPPGDIFAFGVVAFELVTGETPFRGTSPLATAIARLTTAPLKASSLRKGVPAHWDPVLAIAMARKPEHRFRSASQMVAALKDPARASLTRWRRRGLQVALGVAVLAAALAIALWPRGSLSLDPCPNGLCEPWSNQLTGSESQDQTEAVLIRPSGEVLMGGTVTGTHDLGCGPFQVPKLGAKTAIIAQFTRTGICEWNWLGVSPAADVIFRMYQTPSGRTFAWAGLMPEVLNSGFGPSLILEIVGRNVTQVPTQAAAPKWESVAVDAKDRVVIASVSEGFARTAESPAGIDLMRMLPTGEAEWKAHLADGTNVRVLWMEADGNSDVAVFGSFRNTLRVGGQSFTSRGEADMFLLKVSGASGEVLWARAFGSEADETQDLGLVADAEGNWYGVGEHGGIDLGNGPLTPSVFVAKWSPDGKVLWSRGFGGSSRRDAARRVVLDEKNNPIVFGRFLSPRVQLDGKTIDNVGGSDLYLARFDGRSGGLMALKTYTAVDAPARALAIDLATRNVAIGGRFDKKLSFGQGVFQASGQDGYFASLGAVP